MIMSVLPVNTMQTQPCMCTRYIEELPSIFQVTGPIEAKHFSPACPLCLGSSGHGFDVLRSWHPGDLHETPVNEGRTGQLVCAICF